MARTWEMPADPADEGVTELWDRSGHHWYRDEHCWRSESVGHTGWGWIDMLHQSGPFTDAPPSTDGPASLPFDPVRAPAAVAKVYVQTALDEVIRAATAIREQFERDLSGPKPFDGLLKAVDQLPANKREKAKS